MTPTSSRPSFFRYLRDQESLESYVQNQIRVRLDKRRTTLLDERNIHTYRHGDRWATEASTDSSSTMGSIAAESTIHTIDIINHETTILEKYIEEMAQQLYAELVKHIYQTVGEAAESHGNIVTRKDHHGDIAIGFLTMLEKIEFGVDRHGSAQRPSLHVAPATGKKFIEELQRQPNEYHLKVETLSVQKERTAIGREAERISRFRWK